MKIPTELKIGAHTVSVELVTNHASHDFNTTDDQGCSIIQFNKILIDSEQSKSQIEATLFHEILHFLNPQMDHVSLTSLAEQLYQVLHDNKLLK